MINFPKISCMMVTNGRVEFVKKSIYCFIQQTYAKKELIVLSQGTQEQNQAIRKHIQSLDREDIIFVEAPQKLSLGAMRNLCVELTTADIVCQWDDDDLYHPHRMMAQYHALLGGNIVASFYTQHLKWFIDSGEMYWCDWSIEYPQWRTMLCGSVMFRKYLFYDFDNRIYPEEGSQSDREEDLNLLMKLSRVGKIAPVNYGHHYIYTFHGGNVYDYDHHCLVLRKRVLTDQELLQKEQLLRQTFKLVGIDHKVTVRSKDDVAFQYN